jgi:type III secretory pathway component EscT
MVDRSTLRLWVFLAAAPTAAMAGTIAHDMLGISRGEIRIAALLGAALLAVFWAMSYVFPRLR